MFRAKLSFVALAGVLLFSSHRLLALDDWQPITPEELKLTADPSHPADAIILYHEEVSAATSASPAWYLHSRITRSCASSLLE